MSDNPYLRIPKTPSQSAFEALMEENQLTTCDDMRACGNVIPPSVFDICFSLRFLKNEGFGEMAQNVIVNGKC